MSSIHLSRPLRLARPIGLTSIFGIQPCYPRPSLVSSCHYEKPSGVRSFHIAPAVVAVTQATQDAIISLHSATHMPWFLIIPAFAAGISVFRLPLKVYTHDLDRRRLRLQPVLRAWMERNIRAIHLEAEKSVQTLSQAHLRREANIRLWRTHRRIYSSLGLQHWKSYTDLLGLPFWLIGAECIRRLCGGPRGIIGRFFAGPADEVPTVPSIEGTGEMTGPAVENVAATVGHLSAADPSAASAVVEHAKYLPDPSIALEGCLWFPDLAAADPYHILPIALSAVLVFRLIPRSAARRRHVLGLGGDNELDTVVKESWLVRLRFKLQRVLILLAAAVGPMTMDLPAAIHLYWLCSSLFSWVTNRALAYMIPIKSERVSWCKDTDPPVYITPRQREKSALQTAREEGNHDKIEK
ncbi:hypothetical protein GGR53DRAFT_74554 [Hypoxylon sp. FL1150]|nr:hypothetical protein GGR53DRAFT_74554 [Hypoxylon sp. FL1150]